MELFETKLLDKMERIAVALEKLAENPKPDCNCDEFGHSNDCPVHGVKK